MKTKLLKKVRRRYSIRLEEVSFSRVNNNVNLYTVYDRKSSLSKHLTLSDAIDSLVFFIHRSYVGVVRPKKAVSIKAWWK